MNYDQAKQVLPVNVREYLDTTLSDHGIDHSDPVAAGVLAHAQMARFIDRRVNAIRLTIAGIVCIIGMILTGALGIYYGRYLGWKEASSFKVPVVNLPSWQPISGKDVLIMDTKTWKPYAWIRSDRAYFFPHE